MILILHSALTMTALKCLVNFFSQSLIFAFSTKEAFFLLLFFLGKGKII